MEAKMGDEVDEIMERFDAAILPTKEEVATLVREVRFRRKSADESHDLAIYWKHLYSESQGKGLDDV